MIKNIAQYNFLTTPFTAVKSWELFNIENDSVVLLEQSPDIALAMDYVDYYGTNPILNSECDIALEQQAEDILIYQEGLSGSGKFNSDTDPTNPDGTYKRLVYNTIYKSFYNKYNDPTKIFGVEYIDFPLSRTMRNMGQDFRMFNIPQLIYGDKIVPGTVKFFDTSLDDNVTITDDGYQNLIGGYNLFSKVQTVRNFGNTILTESINNNCQPFIKEFDTTVSETIGVGLISGNLTSLPGGLDDSLINVGLTSGNLTSPPEGLDDGLINLGIIIGD